MTWWEALAVALAGVGAGTINAVVGSGTLLTFPVLLAVGLPPVLANVTNTTGLVLGSVSGAVGYRRELAGRRPLLVRLGAASALGGVIGAALLLLLPDAVFAAVVPVLIALGCVLVLVQPRLAARLRSSEGRPRGRTALLVGGVLLSGVYGGYFGAAQGVLLLGVLGATVDERFQVLNGIKNLLAALVNGVAAAVFAVATDVDWTAAGLVAVGAVIGGAVGARFGRKLPDGALRAAVVLIGCVAIVQLVVR